MDDIVTRLRFVAEIHEGRVKHECIAEAADEIERLRRENDWYKAVNIQLQSDLAEQHEDQFLTYFRQALQRADNDL